MAQGIYKIDELIKVTYQASGATSGLVDVAMDVYDEAGAKDIGQSATMVEIVATGCYELAFTPDAEGKWRVMIDSVVRPGKMVKDYDIVAHNVDSIGDNMAKDNTVAKAGADGDTLETLSDQIDDIDTSAPPMIG